MRISICCSEFKDNAGVSCLPLYEVKSRDPYLAHDLPICGGEPPSITTVDERYRSRHVKNTFVRYHHRNHAHGDGAGLGIFALPESPSLWHNLDMSSKVAMVMMIAMCLASIVWACFFRRRPLQRHDNDRDGDIDLHREEPELRLATDGEVLEAPNRELKSPTKRRVTTAASPAPINFV